MKKYEVHFGDWARTFFGQVPAVFYIELVLRAMVVYLILTISMRLMGKRMSSQLSRNELAALVSLAAAVGVPLMAPNRGLLPAIVIAIVVVGVQRAIAARATISQSFEQLSQGNVSTLLVDSVIQWPVLKKVGISREEVFAQLRAQEIMQLGEIERLYMEANGSFTLIKSSHPAAGLCIIPDADKKLQSELSPSRDIQVCRRCGYGPGARTSPPGKCPNCGFEQWTAAVSGQ